MAISLASSNSDASRRWCSSQQANTQTAMLKGGGKVCDHDAVNLFEGSIEWRWLFLSVLPSDSCCPPEHHDRGAWMGLPSSVARNASRSISSCFVIALTRSSGMIDSLPCRLSKMSSGMI